MDAFRFEIERDPSGDLLVSFSWLNHDGDVQPRMYSLIA